MTSKSKYLFTQTRLRCFFCLLFTVIFYNQLSAQGECNKEPATASIQRENKDLKPGEKNKPGKQHQLKTNSLGYFNKVSNIEPLEKLGIEIFYPKGSSGEQVVVSVEDGGIIDGKRIKVLQLDHDKKATFTFQAGGDPGIYKLLISKGSDCKMLQLWVGPDADVVK